MADNLSNMNKAKIEVAKWFGNASYNVLQEWQDDADGTFYFVICSFPSLYCLRVFQVAEGSDDFRLSQDSVHNIDALYL